MKATTSIFILILFSVVVSCTVTKRVHRPGWHVEWKKNYSTKQEVKQLPEDDNETRLAETSEKTVETELAISEVTQEYSNYEEQLMDVNSEKGYKQDFSDDIQTIVQVDDTVIVYVDERGDVVSPRPRSPVGTAFGITALILLLGGGLILIWAYWLITSAEFVFVFFGIFMLVLGYAVIATSLIMGIVWLVISLSQ